MKLADCEIRPGTVLAVCNNYGTIKASCCGLFSPEDDIDLLPPVYPLIKTSNTSFCEPQIGDLIWVWINTTNPLELFYTFMGDAADNNSDILDAGGYDACNIISRDSSNNSELMWNDQEGWSMKHNGAGVQVRPSGDVEVSNDNSSVKVSENGIKLTTGGESQPAVLGNELKSTLQELISALQKVAAIAKTTPETIQIGISLESSLVGVANKLSKILSTKISLD